MTVTYSIHIVQHRFNALKGGEAVWRGGGYRVPCVGERVTVPTKVGPRTWKVSRITTDYGTELYTVEVVRVTDAYED